MQEKREKLIRDLGNLAKGCQSWVWIALQRQVLNAFIKEECRHGN